MESGTLSSWVALIVSVAVIIGGQIVLLVRFKTAVEGKFKSHNEHLLNHDQCISVIKSDMKEIDKKFITTRQFDKLQIGCRGEIFAKISNHDGNITEIKTEISAMRKDISEMRGMTAQLLALQQGKLS